jgi:uncharacterized protein (AIM24 family)
MSTDVTETTGMNSIVKETTGMNNVVTEKTIPESPFSNIGDKIVNRNGYDTLECDLQPGASIITNHDTLSYMQGGIVPKAQLASRTVFGIFRRSVTGGDLFQNEIINSAQEPRRIVFSPLLQGSIQKIIIQPGETWRFAHKTFLASSPNLKVSGNLNIFRNFRMSFVNGNFSYVTVTAPTEVGVLWIIGHGGIEKHEVLMGANSVPLFINNGCFLGMLEQKDTIDYWKDYTSLTKPGSLYQSFMTNIGFLMKIGEKNPEQPLRPNRLVCIVYTQTLNSHNLENYIAEIARENSEGGSSGGSFAIGAGAGLASGLVSLFKGGRRNTRRMYPRRGSTRRKR